jgi:hypothetical protein
MIDLSAVVSGTPIVGCSTCDRPRRARLAQILELLETVVLLTGFDNPVGDVYQRIG